MVTKHKKIYSSMGCKVLCGKKTIASSPYRSTNFSFSYCPECGMEVRTVGDSPLTDRIYEAQRESSGKKR